MMAFAFSSTACLPSLSIPGRLVGLKAGAFSRRRMDYIHIRKIRKPMVRAVLGSNPRKNATESKGQDYDSPPPGCNRFKVELSKPLGIVLEEDKSGNIFVAEIVKDGNADKSGLVDVGDQLIATSAVVYGNIEDYQGVRVRKGMEIVRLNVRGEKFETVPTRNKGICYQNSPTQHIKRSAFEWVMAAIGTHPGHIKVTLELQKCEKVSPGAENGGLAN